IDDELSNLSPGAMTQIGAISCATGWGIGYLLTRLVRGMAEQGNQSLLANAVKGLERIPGVGSLSRKLQTYMSGIPHDTASLNGSLLRVDAALNPAEVEAASFKRLFGPEGSYHQDVHKWVADALPARSGFNRGHIIQEIRDARSYGRLEQIINNTAESFLPEHMRDIVTEQAKNGGKSSLFNKTVDNLLSSLGQGGKGTANKAFTLGHVDELLAQSSLLSKLEQANLQGKIPQTLYQSITHNLGEQYGSALQQNIDKLLQGSNAAAQAVRETLGLKAGAGYSEAMAALRASKDYVPFWKQLAQNSKGLTRQSIELLPSTPWHRVEQLFERYGLRKALERSGAGQSMLQRFANMFKHFEGFHSQGKPIIMERHALHNIMKRQGIGPIGRFAASIPYFFQRMMMGSRYRHIAAKPMLGLIPSKFGGMLFRLFISTMLISYPLANLWKGDDDLRWPKFFKSLGSSIFGWLGFDMALHMANSEGSLLNRFKPLSKLMYSRILPPLGFTWGGAIKNLVIPMIAASVFGGLSNKLIGAFVGNPEKKERMRKLVQMKKDLGFGEPITHAKHKGLFRRHRPTTSSQQPQPAKKNLGQRSDNTPPPIPTNHNAFSRELDEALSQTQTRPYVAFNTGIPTQVDDNPMQWEDWAWGSPY
ncbi:MAG: hypothetical protein KC476_10790, partial [Cyanobacteria bacterium HKST-UBA06]|nr:hypothetical protein [Cyanobacteria bacterium HKST-UBA06]